MCFVDLFRRRGKGRSVLGRERKHVSTLGGENWEIGMHLTYGRHCCMTDESNDTAILCLKVLVHYGRILSVV